MSPKRNFKYYHDQEPSLSSKKEPTPNHYDIVMDPKKLYTPFLTSAAQDIQALFPDKKVNYRPQKSISLLCTPNEEGFCHSIVQGLISKQLPASLQLIHNPETLHQISKENILFILSHEVQSMINIPTVSGLLKKVDMLPVETYQKETKYKKTLWKNILALWTT